MVMYDMLFRSDCINTRVFIMWALCMYITTQAQNPIITIGHSHNDYKRKRPLYDALDNGFFSIEADIFYNKGKFSVAHTRFGIRKHRTLEQLYLIPLKQIVENNNGRVYTNGLPEFELMIDFKGKWTPEYMRLLEKKLLEYASLFTRYENGIHQAGAVKVILSGSRYLKWIENDNPRLFCVDAGMELVGTTYDNHLMCRNSMPYRNMFKWRGCGNMPAEEKQTLRQLCEYAKKHGRKIRFWACPEREKIWRELLDAGVGWVNVDRLQKFRKFYFEKYLPLKKQHARD